MFRDLCELLLLTEGIALISSALLLDPFVVFLSSGAKKKKKSTSDRKQHLLQVIAV